MGRSMRAKRLNLSHFRLSQLFFYTGQWLHCVIRVQIIQSLRLFRGTLDKTEALAFDLLLRLFALFGWQAVAEQLGHLGIVTQLVEQRRTVALPLLSLPSAAQGSLA